MRDTWDDDSYKREEPTRIAIDDEGRFVPKSKYAKWQTPKGMIQNTILHAVQRKRYYTREEQMAVNEVAKQSLSLTTGVDSPYPTEWIEFCCAWAMKQREEARKKGERSMGLESLVKWIKNKDKMDKWLDENRHKYPKKEETWSDYANKNS